MALDDVGRWLMTQSDQTYRLFGYAGTGKTTLAKHLAEGVSHVLFGAYTGKAASVMQKKGCSSASTIHKLIYLPTTKSKGHLLDLEQSLCSLEAETSPEDRETDAAILRVQREIVAEKARLRQPAFTLNPESSVKDADLVVVDECSMVDEQMGTDLLSFGTPVLVLGDPAQLPPVRGGGFFTSQRPDVMLTEIHRQARDNPIIDLATKVRQGEPLLDGPYGDSLVMRGKPDQALVMGADQILVGLNDTRRRCNHRMRSLLGYPEEPVPQKGDKIVCLRNDREEGLLNGTLWTVDEATLVGERVSLDITDDRGFNTVVEAHVHYFQGREKELPFYVMREAQAFDFGYALTVHKAQGSQWPSVFIFDESWAFRGSARQWLYTALTRASEKVVICRS
jgi:exodeoxyribonuclease-5